MPRISPCLWFDDQADAAVQLYCRALPNARRLGGMTYPNELPNPSGKPPGSTLTIDFTAGGVTFTALNGGPHFKPNATISFFVLLPTVAEVDACYAALSEGGQVLMPLDSYPWSSRYAWVTDAYGVSWQVMFDPTATQGQIVPCLMFSDAQRGNAQAALAHYTHVFPHSAIELTVPYQPDEAGPSSTPFTTMIKHGRAQLAGQPLIAMDSHIPHQLRFNEGVSLQIICSDQTEVDHYWHALGDSGAFSQCGWLKDQFGVSWQVVPQALTTWLTHPAPGIAARAFAAMLNMQKIDITAVEKAVRRHGEA